MVFDVRLQSLVSSNCRFVVGTRKSRRIISKFLSLLAICAFFATCGPLRAAERMNLVPATAADQGARVRSVQEVKGDLKLNADGRQVTRLPFEARGLMEYDQRVLHVAAGVRRDARFYRQARARINVGAAPETSELSPDRRTVVVDCDPRRTRIYSPLGPLTRDELELIDVQGNPALLDRLLPAGDVSVGDRWKHDDRLIAQLFGLDAVQRNELSSTLRAVESEIVVIDLSGQLRGAIGGVSSDLEVKAKYHFDRARRLVRWLAMTIKENRSIGHASPGFDVTARIQISIDPAEVVDYLRDAALANLDLNAEPGSLMLAFASQPGGFRFLHDRSWQAMVDRHDVAVLRMIDRGDLIAQCNASKLPDLPAGQRVALEAYQADIQRALAGEFGEFLQATQGTSGDGFRVLRVVVAGLAGELPIQWRYYHVSNDAGRQVSFVFTMDAKLVERFAEADEGIIGSFEFVGATGTPTPAPAPGATLGPAREASSGPATAGQLR